MIPLRDTATTKSFPSATVALIGANFLLFIQELRASPDFLQRIIFAYGLVPDQFMHWVQLGGSPLSLARVLPLVTSMFLHGGWLHLLGNMLYLWIFGDVVEDRLGHGRFVAFYLVCGIAAGLLQCFFDPESPVPTVGASGAIAGVLGAYLMTSPRAKIMTFVPVFFIPWIIEIPAVVFLILWFAAQVISGLFSMGRALNGGVAWWAHVGGFVAGMLLVMIVPKSKTRAVRSR
jgi:membrane associated rhomboid family serine protease